MENKFKNIIEVAKYFSDETVCRNYLEKLRWKDGNVKCPHCKHDKVYKFSDNKTYKCAKCRKKFTVIVGSVFENTNIALQKWLMALYLVSSSKKGISSIELGKVIGVTQKTAWFMLHRIRLMVKEKEITHLSNIVEVDETFVGGKYKNKHKNKRLPNGLGKLCADKTSVFGMLERGGKVRSCVVPDIRQITLQKIIFDNVAPGSTIMSDEWKAYKMLPKEYTHYVVAHGKGQYVDGNNYTNTLEGYWGLFKRNITGVYHYVSRKHLDRYCNEFDYKYNTKNDTIEDRFNKALSGCGEIRLKYKDLVE